MPHPERACHPLLGSTDGLVLLDGLLAAADARVPHERAMRAGRPARCASNKRVEP